MSVNHGDNKIKQINKSLGQVATMGNLFSKEEDPEGHNSQKEASPGEDFCSDLPYVPSVPTVADQERFFKILEKTTAHSSLMEGEDDDAPVTESEKVILNAFLHEVRNAKPAPLKNWSAFQHFVYFIYRHVLSAKPINSNEIFPSVITKKIRDLVESLLQEDFTQLCIRLVTLVREYAIIARGYFDNLELPKVAAYLVSLMSYYSAFCSAANKLAPLLPEFDFLIMERFNVNWLCLNKSIFYHYIYMSPGVQTKIPAFLKLKEENKPPHKNLLESYSCFSEDMSLIATRWATLRIRICNLSHKRALSNPMKHLLNDWRMFEEHKKLLKTSYWMLRNTQAMQLQDMTELDAHILSLVGDTAYISDFLIDINGHCMCEDCLAAEFRSSSLNAIVPTTFHAQSSAMSRLITCYICQDAIALDALASHIVTKHHDSFPLKPSRVFLTPHQKRFSKKCSKSVDPKSKDFFPFEGIFARNKELKQSLLNIGSGHGPKNNVIGCEKQTREVASLTDSACNAQIEIEGPSFQPTKKMTIEPIFKPTETEELKHKPASTSRIETVFPLKSSASPVFQKPNESSFKIIKEPVFKIASKPPVMQNGNEMMFKGASKTNDNLQSCRAALDEFLKHREATETPVNKTTLNDSVMWKSTDVANKKATEVLMKSAELFSAKDVPKNVGEKTPSEPLGKKPNFIALTTASAYVNTAASENISFRKPQQKGIGSVDPKMFEFLKNANANAQKSVSGAATKSTDNTCSGHACGHKCKQEDDKQAEAKKHSCQDTCEHYKESRKCDCAYCEVFGSSLPPHTHKTNETRDRLRTRLNQRKEKVNEGVNKGAPQTPTLNTKLTSKNNGSLNCTIKISGNSKISVLNGKSLNVSAGTTKVNVKSIVVKESDILVPPRVPEVVHPVPIPTSTKPVLAPAEPKKPPASTDTQIPISGAQKVSVARGIPIYTAMEPKAADSNTPRPSSSLSTSSLDSDNVDSRDINELLNYIEGNKPVDKVALAKKKAAKKARQRSKKAQERDRQETEKRLKEEARLKEEKRKEEARVQAEELARQLAAKQKKNKRNQEEAKAQSKQQESKKGNRKKNRNSNEPSKEMQKQSNLIEETIPAMVTIKRVAEGNDSPATVTITLKGSTPESDKLLFTLVNGHNNKEHVKSATVNTNNKDKNKNQNKTTKPKAADSMTKMHSQPAADNLKTSKKKKKNETSEIASKELQVKFAVDKNNVNKKTVPNKKNKSVETPKIPESKVFKPINKPMEYKSIPATKPVNSVRDDINLPMLRLPPGITITKIEGPPANRNCKTSLNTNASMQNTHNPNVRPSKSGVIVVDTEKLIQQSITASNLKKNKKKKRDQKQGNPEDEGTLNDKGVSNGSPFNAQEITTVDKNLPKNKSENKKVSQPAEVSIIPTSNGANRNDTFSFDKDDWLFESVFAPRDVLEEDMDEEEIEIEAFKRFCQQSIPPERRETVPHLNMNDIILTMKRGVTYS